MIRCGNVQCSGVGACSVWSECPMFRPAQEKKKTEKKIRPSEDGEQETVVEFCRLSGIKIVHIPNEGKRSAAQGAKMKRMGLSKGFPDLFIPIARKGFHGLFIELKRDRYSHPTAEQTQWICYLNNEGYFATVCYGAPAAIAEIRKYLGRKQHE